MSNGRRHSTSGPYAIRVQGRLEERWAGWFDGCTFTHGEDGTTVLTASEVDQSALHGVLQVLRDLGLPLLSVTALAHDLPADEREAVPTTSPAATTAAPPPEESP